MHFSISGSSVVSDSHTTHVAPGRASTVPQQDAYGRWCTSQTQIHLCICVRTRGLQHPSPPPGSRHGGSWAQAGHGGFSFPCAQAEAISQAQLPEGKTCGVCPWQGTIGFLLPPCPTFSHGGHQACTPQDLQSTSSDGLQCPFPPQGHRSFLLLSPNPPGWSRVHPCQSQPHRWQDKHE